MINIDNEKAIMTFGTGDIGINTYIRTDIDEKGIIFYNQKPRRIGAIADIKANTIVENINDYPVKMIFSKTESINVVIEMLEELKKLICPSKMNLQHYLERLSEDDKNTFCYLLDEMELDEEGITIR